MGEPINPEAWLWYYKIVGKNKCSIVDTFWQTETGGHVITPLPGATPMKPGSAVRHKTNNNFVAKILNKNSGCSPFRSLASNRYYSMKMVPKSLVKVKDI